MMDAAMIMLRLGRDATGLLAVLVPAGCIALRALGWGA